MALFLPGSLLGPGPILREAPGVVKEPGPPGISDRTSGPFRDIGMVRDMKANVLSAFEAIVL